MKIGEEVRPKEGRWKRSDHFPIKGTIIDEDKKFGIALVEWNDGLVYWQNMEALVLVG